MQNYRTAWPWKTALVVLVAIAAADFWASHPQQSLAQVNNTAPGRQVLGGLCTVYVRGDVSGLAIHDRLGSLGNLISCTGKVVQLTDEWLVLAGDDQSWWIPRTSIALISSKDKP